MFLCVDKPTIFAFLSHKGLNDEQECGYFALIFSSPKINLNPEAVVWLL